MPVWLIIAVTTVYVLGLFFIAWKGDKDAQIDAGKSSLTGVGYALALAVYCTSWTYFGAVGTAVSAGSACYSPNWRYSAARKYYVAF